MKTLISVTTVLRGYVGHEVCSFSVEYMTVCQQFICYELPFKFLKALEPFIESNNSYDAVSFAEANSQNAAPFIHRFVRGDFHHMTLIGVGNGTFGSTRFSR